MFLSHPSASLLAQYCHSMRGWGDDGNIKCINNLAVMLFGMRSQKNINTIWRQGLSMAKQTTVDSLQDGGPICGTVWGNSAERRAASSEATDSWRDCALAVTAETHPRSGQATEYPREGGCLLPFDDAVEELIVSRKEHGFRVQDNRGRLTRRLCYWNCESVITSDEITRPRDQTEQGHSNENWLLVILTEEIHRNLRITHSGSGILYSFMFNETIFW
jgi:hypothetical protein